MHTHQAFKDYLDRHREEPAVQELNRRPLLYSLAEKMYAASQGLPSSRQELYQYLFDTELRLKLRTDNTVDILRIIRGIIPRFAFCLFKGDSFEGLNGIIRESIECTHHTIQAMGDKETACQLVRDSIFKTGILSPYGCDPALFPYLVATGLKELMKTLARKKTSADFDLFLRTEIIARLSDPLWHEPFRLFAGMLSKYDFDDLLRAFLHPEAETQKKPDQLRAMRILFENVTQVEVENTIRSLLLFDSTDEEWWGFVIEALRSIGNPFLLEQERTSLQKFIAAGNVPAPVITKTQELLAWAEEEVTRIDAERESGS